MTQISSNDEFFNILNGLVDSWCDRRCLHPLARILGPYLGFNGLTDGWAELQDALKSVRALDRELLLEPELVAIGNLVNAIDRAIGDRN
jgi:hypothetical protein